MDIRKILRITLFFFDLVRLLLLAVSFMLFTAIRIEGTADIFPYLVYLSANALFPLISLFLLIKPLEYINYLPLYIAGKTLSVILFYIWAAVFLPFEAGFLSSEYYARGILLLGCVFFVSLEDALSIIGSLIINKKTRQIRAESNGGL